VTIAIKSHTTIKGPLTKSGAPKAILPQDVVLAPVSLVGDEMEDVDNIIGDPLMAIHKAFKNIRMAPARDNLNAKEDFLSVIYEPSELS
jgi:hypothetical protein